MAEGLACRIDGVSGGREYRDVDARLNPSHGLIDDPERGTKKRAVLGSFTRVPRVKTFARLPKLIATSGPACGDATAYQRDPWPIEPGSPVLGTEAAGYCRRW